MKACLALLLSALVCACGGGDPEPTYAATDAGPAIEFEKNRAHN